MASDEVLLSAARMVQNQAARNARPATSETLRRIADVLVTDDRQLCDFATIVSIRALADLLEWQKQIASVQRQLEVEER